MSNAEPALVGTPEVARETGLDEKTVRKAIASGQIPAMRFGRVWKVPRWWVNQQRNGPNPIEAA